MNNFFEIMIDGHLHLINTKNIALVKQVESDLTEIHLLTKKDNEQINFKVAFNYINFKKALDDEDEFSIDFILNEFQD